MKKDVIYIDVEDDITAIIGKVKASTEKVIALVPPKRVGVLQSAVNLRLLARAAETTGKHLVLITASTPLISLAAAAKIPVARNLQSKPELAEIPVLEVDNGDDIIDGAQLPVGELTRTADIPVKDYATLDDDDKAVNIAPVAAPASALAAAGAKNASANKPKRLGKSKVPNFDTFRKKLVLFGGLGVLLISFLVWAIFFAPRATIVIAARTSDSPVSSRITLGDSEKTDFKAATLRSVTHSLEKSASVEFEATGREERGESARGTITLSRGVGGAVRVPAGTSFSSGEYTFTSDQTVTVPGASLATGSATIVPGTADVSVTATAIGSEYNLSPRSYTTDAQGVSARGGQMSGGAKREVKLVTAQDVQAAKEKLAKQDEAAVKKELNGKFGNGVKIIESSFVATPADPQASPDVGDESDSGKANLTSKITYRMTGVSGSELNTYLKQALESKIANKNEQRVYETGEKKAELTDFTTNDNTTTVAIRATGKVGPQIDEAEVKEDARDKQYGEVQQVLESVNGVSEVDIKFWPFWVRTVPDNVKKITVEFNLETNGR